MCVYIEVGNNFLTRDTIEIDKFIVIIQQTIIEKTIVDKHEYHYI